MTDIVWAVPAALGLTGALLAAAIVVLVVRVHRRSPRARTAASAAVARAHAELLRLDDAIDDLDIAIEAADATPADDAPADVRRFLAAAQRARDRGFVDAPVLAREDAVPTRRRADAEHLRAALEIHLERVAAARALLDDWARSHRTPEALVAAARRRRDETVSTAGDPAPLLAALAERFDIDDWCEAATAADEGTEALAEADARIAEAASQLTDPSAVTKHVEAATDAIRRAGRHLRAVEDAHRIALQAAENAPAELAAARAEIAAAIETARTRRADCAPDAAAGLRAAAADIETAAARADRRPRIAVETVARVRERRDALLADAPSPRLRLENARAALPGTLACARAALAVADARSANLPIDERLRVETARRELASSRASTDAGRALHHARAAWHAVARPSPS